MGKFWPGLDLRHSRYSDRVFDLRPRQWGHGEVMEEKHSGLPGGTCMVRVASENGMERTFINDMDSSMCRCLAGLRLD